MNHSIFEQGLPKTQANHVPLSPLTFIERSASIYPDYPAVVHGEIRRSWSETWSRCRRLASALEKRGIKPGETVAAMLPNVPAMFEAHFGVPLAGCVLNTLNIRLDADAIAYMLEHGEAQAVLVDPEFAGVIEEAVSRLAIKPLVIDVDDALPDDEWQAISLNYTSGTTGKPKGVVYHHRGAYLNAVSNRSTWAMGRTTRCTSGPCRCSTATAGAFPGPSRPMAGVSVCLRRVDPKKILRPDRRREVTHLCGAPIVLNALVNFPPEQKPRVRSPGEGHGRRRRAARLGHRCTRDAGHRRHPRLRPHRGLRPGDRMRLAPSGTSCRWMSAPGSRRARACATTCSRR
jgi:fatty-acyl-CoA synthase